MTSLRLAALETTLQPSRSSGSATPAPFVPGLVAVALALGIVAGMAIGNGPLTLVAALGTYAAAVISPPTGLLIFAFMSPLTPPLVIPAPGYHTLLVGAILLGCVYRLPIDRPRIRLGAPLALLLGFTVYAGLQQLPEALAGYAGESSRYIGYLFIQLATCTSAAFAAAHVLAGRNPLPFLLAGVLGGGFAALLAIAVYVLPQGAVAGLVAMPEATARVVGPFGDPNYFGLFQGTAIVACLALIAMRRDRGLRALLVAVLVVLLIAFAITFSRGALVALGAGVLVLAFLRSRRSAIAALAALAVLALVVYPVFVEWRLAADVGRASAQAYAGLERSDASRIAAALAGPQLFLTSPVFGVGFGQYPLLSGRFTGYPIESHNWYMNVLAEQGLVGVLLWLPMLATIAATLRRLPRDPRSLGLPVFATYVVGSIFLQPPLSLQTSAFAIVAIAAAAAGDWVSTTKSRRHEREMPPAGLLATRA